MALNMVVLAKCVPDTKNITTDAMKADGTVNRAALPFIFNPEDLNALELALQLKERYGGRVTVLTMGLPQAGELLRESLYRGADRVVLMTDRRFAGADTLATSYSLAQAIRTLGGVSLVLCGRQAIDGDTAQVGPQVAEKLGWPQITYVEEVQELTEETVRARRALGRGFEVWETPLPAVITVVASANEPRPPAAKLLIKYKRAKAPSEVQMQVHTELSKDGTKPDPAEVQKRSEKIIDELKKRGLLLEEWRVEDIKADLSRVGQAGSPTRVKEIEFVVIQGTDTKMVEATEDGLAALVHELIQDHTLG
jgi:electron transfer flavoprotein beta subunit